MCIRDRTKAQPTVADVVSFNGQPAEELLRIAACLEEHFPHSMAKAVVRDVYKRQAEKRPGTYRHRCDRQLRQDQRKVLFADTFTGKI